MKDFWEELLSSLSGRLQGRVFDTWIKPLSFVEFRDGNLVVEAPDPFFKQWLEEHHGHTILGAARELAHGDVGLRIEVRSQPPEKDKKPQKPHAHPAPPRPSPSPSVSNKYAFDEFIVGASNQFAHAACFAVANNPAHNYNPLFLFGGVGLGKTHLLNAIGHHILKNNTRAKVCYVTSEQFTNELINSIRYQKMSSFRDRYRSLEVLLLDDIQFMAGKERTQEEFFHTFNSLYGSHQQIVITSDTFPKDMQFLEERLRSRFGWGLIADIQPPDFETMVAILKQKARAYNLHLPNDLAFFLASCSASNVRELEGLLNRVVAYSSLNSCDLNLDLAKDVLKNLIPSREGEANVGTIQKVVSSHFNLRVSDLKSNRKQKAVVLPRQICMYLTRRFTKMSFPEIGSHFGGKDHSTIIYAVNKIKKQLDQNENIKNTINNLINKLNS